MGKNVAVFVDVANIFYAAKAAGVDIDYVTLLKASTAGRDFVRAYAYTGLDPENENQRNFHAFLSRHGYKVVSKDIRKYGDGKVKANLDIELVVDMMKTARNLDIAVVVSGDGDFAPAIRAVQEMGVRVEVVSFRGNTSSDLIDVADLFTDITHVAKVEKGSSRSGRRVAGDEEDLSMTEVPEKQTEGTGRRRGRGRARTVEAPAAAASTPRGRGRARTVEAPAAAAAPAAAPTTPEPAASGAGLVALPGERLSKAAGTADEEEVPAAAEPDEATGDDAGIEGEPHRRRRRRRGGRGRGRGRAGETAAMADEEVEEPRPVEAARAPRTTPFGSVWDSQLGVPSTPASLGPISQDEEDFEEPEIPEYLIAEQRRDRGRGGRGARGGRGGRSAYSAAVERERYGGGRSTSLNRYPDVSGRTGARSGPGRRTDRPDRGSGRSSSEPWSEVPPELEEMLRAQVAARSARLTESTSPEEPATEPAEPATEAAEPKPTRRRTTRKAATSATEPAEPATEAAEPKPTRRRTTRKAATSATEPAEPATEGTEPAQPRRRTRRTKAVETPASSEPATAAETD